MSRLPSIDILRVVVVSMIVYRHTFGSSDLMIASVGIPFFFFLTGWLWRSGSRTVSDEAGHRWRTLGIPYLIWLAILYPVFLAAFAIQGELTLERGLSPLLGGAYVGAAYTTFWFIGTLLAVALLMRLIDRLKMPVLIVLAFVTLAVGGWFGEELALVPLGFGVALSCLGFSILGKLARAWTPSSGVGRGVVAVAVAVVAVPLTILCEPLNIKYGDFGTPIASAVLSSAIIWAAIVLLDSLFAAIPNQSRRLARVLGPFTAVAIIVVLTHPVVLWVAKYLQPSGQSLWMFFVALIVPWAFALVIVRTPLSRFLVGQGTGKGGGSSLQSVPTHRPVR